LDAQHESARSAENINVLEESRGGMNVAQRRAEMNASPQLATALRHGVIAAQARDFDRARPLLQHVTEKTPEDVIAWYWLAIASPSAEAAIPCLRRVLTIDGDHLLAREALSRLLIAEAHNAAAAGRRDEARMLATEATDLAPDSSGSWRALVELAQSQVERIDALRRLAHLSPEDAALRLQLRQALMARGVMIARSDREEARARFQEVAALNPADIRIWQALFNLAESQDEQAKYLRELLRIAPDHQPARSTLRRILVESARVHRAAGELAEARVRWREAIDVAGSDVELWLGFAEACDDQTEALRAIHAAQELDSHDPRVLEAIAHINGHQIDPHALPDDDAFARFDAATAPVDPATLVEPVDDSLLDALAQLPEAPPAPSGPAKPVAVAQTAPAAPPVESVVTETFAPVTPTVVTAPVSAPVFADPAPAPIAEPAPIAHDAAPAAPAPRTNGHNGNGGPMTVLVVDDSPTIRKILGLTLEREGYKVLAEANGESALKRLQEIVPHVVLLDIAMPDLDGYEVCKRIKQDPRTSAVPVIMLSGKGAFFDKVKGHLAGATEYLTKPFETPAVLAVVSTHCHAGVEAHHG
jgi:twitching motility two-component system response regulator PilG